MTDLFNRLIKKCRDEGITTAVHESICYLKYVILHTIGKNRFYDSDYYWDILIWLNSKKWKYNATADPFKIIWINPNEIKDVTGRKPFPGRFQWIHSGLIMSGKWDVNNNSFDDKLIYKAMKNRYKNDYTWEKTEFIQKVKSDISDGILNWRGVKTGSEIDRQCNEVDHLFQNISTSGFKTSSELLKSGLMNTNKRQLPDKYLKHDEIAVDINRNGKFLFVDGRHRLSAAKILDLDEIPVRVVARHSEWQKIRENVSQNKSLHPELSNHPDLQNLL